MYEIWKMYKSFKMDTKEIVVTEHFVVINKITRKRVGTYLTVEAALFVIDSLTKVVPINNKS